MKHSRTLITLAAAVMVLLTMAACGAESRDDRPQGNESSEPIDAETRAYVEDTTTALAQQLQIKDPPDIEPVRLIPLNEWGSTQIACLREEGHSVTETDDGQGVQYPAYEDEALRQSLNLAIYTCEAKYPTQQKYMEPLSDDGLRELYEYRSGDLVECLENAGYPVAGEPPSEGVFVESDGVWSPYESISLAGDLKELFISCPQTPDSVYGK